MCGGRRWVHRTERAGGHCSRDPAVLSLMLGGVIGEKQKDQEWGLVQSQKAGRAEGNAEGIRCEVQEKAG